MPAVSRLRCLAVALLLLAGLGGCTGTTARPAADAASVIDDPATWSEARQAGYAFGFDSGRSLLEAPAYADRAAFLAGLDDRHAGRPLRDDERSRLAARKDVARRLEQAPADAAGDARTTELAARVSYAIGVDVAQAAAPAGETLDWAALRSGADDALSGREPKLDERRRIAASRRSGPAVLSAAAATHAREAETNRESSARFLAANARRPGVRITASGLQYEVLHTGKGGRHPQDGDHVTVAYVGRLPDGTVFDDAHDRAAPIRFTLDRVIAGWAEGLKLMDPGARFRFAVPAPLAYGTRGAGGRIGPEQALVFEIELLSID